MDSALYANYLNILKQELVPALGCTEPIAIAYAAAKARQILGEFPDTVEGFRRCFEESPEYMTGMIRQR